MASCYRIVMVTKLGFGGPGDTSVVVWEGSADEMSAQYPIQALDDPMARSTDFAVGSTTRHIIEVWVDDDIVDSPYDGPGVLVPGHWMECDDPRNRSELAGESMEA